jgi:hypothetical protein
VKERIATDPEAMPIIIGDRAGFHLELLWDPVKRRIAHDVWETLENIEAAIREV